MEVESYIQREVVLVNISGNAPALEKVMQHAMQRWWELHQPTYHDGVDSKFILEVNYNWKLAVECYHLPW